MKRIYYWIEELFWRLDSCCHSIIEWTYRKRTGDQRDSIEIFKDALK